MKLLIIDTETSNSDNQVCEIAATLYTVNQKHKGAIASISTLIPIKDNEFQRINGISPFLTLESSEIYQQSLQLLDKMIFQSDHLVAFNSDFHQPIVGELVPSSLDKPWLCAMRDFNWGLTQQYISDILKQIFGTYYE